MVVLSVQTIYGPVCYAVRVIEIQNGFKQLYRTTSINVN